MIEQVKVVGLSFMAVQGTAFITKENLPSTVRDPILMCACKKKLTAEFVNRHIGKS